MYGYINCNLLPRKCLQHDILQNNSENGDKKSLHQMYKSVKMFARSIEVKVGKIVVANNNIRYILT